MNIEGYPYLHQLPPEILPILAAIRDAGGRPLVVGGAVRDLLMSRPPLDADIEVYGLDGAQLREVLSTLGKVEAVGRSFGVLKLRVGHGRSFDLSLPRRESRTGLRGTLGPGEELTPREAAARRDFTWNALAITPEGELLDFFGGAADLRNGVIRHVSDAFGDDPLRVLRAMQFAARFGMRLAPETAQYCRALLPRAADLAIERIWGEWHKWALQGVFPAAGLQALRDSGWIARYPELAALIGCPQHARWHPEGDVMIHTGLVCDAARRIADRERLDNDSRILLLLAALCHDLGKPVTTILRDGVYRSPGHAQAGVAPTEALLARIGAPQRVVDHVVPLVREHMAYLANRGSERAVRRLAVRLAPATIELWGLLAEADFSGRPPLPPGNPGATIVAVARRIGAEHGRPAALVQGRDLLALGMQPGPQFGELLRRAYQAQIDGEFATTAEGIEWVMRTENREPRTEN
jgi:tRNA nucleotidyltransferase (CCA-adding enzyme)